MSINNTVLVGRLTKDVELKYSQTGTAVARFNLAVNRQFKKDGQPDADFISCVAFGKTAENLANFMRKGSQIGVTGRIQTGSYDDKDGKRVYTTDVVADNIQFLESRSETQGNNQGGYQQQAPPRQQYQQQPQQQQQQYQQPPQQQQYQQQGDPFAQPQQGGNYAPHQNDDDLPF